jgi:molybdopterin molybdotransferase
VIPLDEARQLVVSACPVLGTEARPLGAAIGSVLAEAVIAPEAVPGFASSAMDGYALRSADVARAPAVLEVIGSVMAGDGRPVRVGAGQAARVMTGAPVPDGADAVCMVEHTRTEDDGRRVVIEVPVPAGAAVREPGSDVAEGSEVAAAGTVLTPAHLGVLARLGLETVTVRRSPTVGVLSTGDELREGPGPLPVGAIRDANRPMLMALIRAAGFCPIDLGIVGDDAASVRTALLEGAQRCDALVTSGGVSVGDLDVVRMVLEALCGSSMRWMQIAIRPAKPFAFGLIDGRVPVFGLPGNPVSSSVSFELLARPALRRMAGHRDLLRPALRARSATALERRPDGKTHFLRAWATVDPEGQIWVRSAGGQESHQLKALADANALVVLEDGTGVGSGEEVPVLLLDAERLSYEAHS